MPLQSLLGLSPFCRKNATFNYMPVCCFFFYLVFAFLNIWTEIMFEPIIGCADKIAVFHWRCCYTFIQSLQVQRGARRRWQKEKEFQINLFQLHCSVWVPLCSCCSSSLMVFFSSRFPTWKAKVIVVVRAILCFMGMRQDYLYKQIYPTGFCCLDTVLPTEQLYNIKLYICVLQNCMYRV